MNGRGLAVVMLCVALGVWWWHGHPARPHPVSATAVENDAPCSGDDCRGFRTGYIWAENHQVTAAKECVFTGADTPFARGCRAYLKDKKNVSEPPVVTPAENDDDDPPDPE